MTKILTITISNAHLIEKIYQAVKFQILTFPFHSQLQQNEYTPMINLLPLTTLACISFIFRPIYCRRIYPPKGPQ